MTWIGADGLAEQLEEQRRFVEHTVPAYGRLLAFLRERLDRLAEPLQKVWATREFNATYERPLLLLAGLRYLALLDGLRHPLYRGVVQPGNETAITEQAVRSALEDARLWPLLESRLVQTNETSRAVVWLWLASLISKQYPDASFSLNDIGASAGLNLVGDRLDTPWRDQESAPLWSPAPTLSIAERVGFDPSPLDATAQDDARWLLACVWPGQAHRHQRLEQAIGAFRELAATANAPQVLTASAVEAARQLRQRGSHSISYHTVVRDYLKEQERTEYTKAMLTWLAERPLRHFWAQLELAMDDAPPERSAVISVHCFDGQRQRAFALARCHPHPSRLQVRREQVTEFTRVLATGAVLG